jgi:hypothetical protein
MRLQTFLDFALALILVAITAWTIVNRGCGNDQMYWRGDDRCPVRRLK